MFKTARSNWRRSSGLTLIEVLCVLAIICLIFLAGIGPGFGFRQGSKRQLEGAAWQLVSEMRLARQSAVSTGITSRLQFRVFNNDYKIALADERKTVKLPAGICYTHLNFPVVGGYYLLEYKCTGAPNRGGTIGLINRQKEKIYIIVTPATGRVRVSPEPPP